MFFKFAPEVSALLTQLTTYNGFVPQGGVTSSYLANIALWDVEHSVFEKIVGMGFTYTRYVDDINMSSTQKNLPDEVIQTAIKLVYSMMRKAGIRPNRKKHQIMTKSVPIKIHKLNINAGRPTMPKDKRDRIRLETYNLRKLAESCLRKGKKYYNQHTSISGKIRELSKFHAAEGRKLMKSIDGITPLYIPNQPTKRPIKK